jgi:hypothetical protein
LNDDVRCTHGATTGQIDQDQLFYLMARGIDPRTGAQLLAHGFFEEVIARLPEKKIGEAVRSAVAAKFAAMRSLPAPQLPRERRGKMNLEEVSETLDVRALQGLAK